MQDNNKLEINQKSLETELKGYKNEPLKALAEYIWNWFDAWAKNIRIIFNKPLEWIWIISDVTIKDDWEGWDFTEIETKNFLSSSKADVDNQNKTLPHWKLWRWRYTFIWFAHSLEVKSNQKKMILKKDTSIDNTGVSDINKWTEVRLVNISTELSQYLDTDVFKEFLSLEFWWFLKGDKNLKIFINEEVLDYSWIVEEEYLISKNDFPDDLKEKLLSTDIKASIVIWNKKPKEFSKFFIFKNIESPELFTKTTWFNRKWDDFWHSVYIYSDIFEEQDRGTIDDNDDQQMALELNANKKLKKKIFDALKDKLTHIRRPLLQEKSRKIVSDLHIEESIPRLDEYWIYDTDSFDALLKEAYVIAPSLFSWKWPQDRLFICTTFAALLSSQDSSLIRKILEQVFWLEKEDKEKLEELLDRTNLANIVRTAAEVQSRLDILTDLETLLFKFEKETLEVKHLQQVLNENPWIFGEQFRLFTNTEWALKDTLYKYAKDILEIDEPDIESISRKELDFFLVKTYPETESIKRNIIVEIKRPSINLWKKEYDQIEKYANDILEESICNDWNTYWEFYLIWNDYNSDIKRKIENAKQHGEEYKWLTENTLDWKRKIYVRKWSEIIWVEHRNKMHYLQDKLKLKQKDISGDTPDTIVYKVIS